MLGTITFSTLALYQNHIINEQNKQFNPKLKEIEMQRDMPRFAVQNIWQSGNYTNLTIVIKNISDNPATNVKVFNFTVYDIDGNDVCHSQNVIVKGSILEAQSTIEIDFINAALKDSNLNICFFIEYQDIFLIIIKLKLLDLSKILKSLMTYILNLNTIKSTMNIYYNNKSKNVSRQAANLSSKQIENCEYASSLHNSFIHQKNC